MNKLRILITAGGTGGHIFPAVAVAKAMEKSHENTEFLFVGALGKMEMQKVPAEGYAITGLPIQGLQRTFDIRNLILPFKLVISLLKALFLLLSFKPRAVVGFGGYASFPVGIMALLLGIPLYIQEQNAYAGLTNRVLGKAAKRIFVATEGMNVFFNSEKIFLAGNPVRPEITASGPEKSEAKKQLGFNPDLPLVFVTGGSLGAKAINEGILEALPLLAAQEIQLFWQTGEPFNLQAQNAVKAYDSLFQQTAFTRKMDVLYRAADLVVSRAGAIAIAELAIMGKPSILVPLPTAAENHQYHNAKRLQDDGAARLLANHKAPHELGKLIVDCIIQKEALQHIGKKMAEKGMPFAAETIAKTILNDLAV
jgi:UDP-N-acetylglucosamine--N-acetylmuramyl-(pentapeptide) pyrophosphoryl-undecaprenol N-acetylglucosamine transferase